MRKLPAAPIPWKQGDPLTARHLDNNRQVLSALIAHKGPQQLDQPATDANESSPQGNAAFVSKLTREETVSIFDDSGTLVGTATIEVRTATQFRRDGVTYWEYYE